MQFSYPIFNAREALLGRLDENQMLLGGLYGAFPSIDAVNSGQYVHAGGKPLVHKGVGYSKRLFFVRACAEHSHCIGHIFSFALDLSVETSL